MNKELKCHLNASRLYVKPLDEDYYSDISMVLNIEKIEL
jgi:hypothetical protein